MLDVILDCDNTMGLEEKDVDDGLVLIYLLGREDINIKGVTTVFGNGSQNEVYEETSKLIETLKGDLSIYRGAETAGNNLVDNNNQGASYLVEESSRNKVTLLAIGPLTNLKQAFYKDSSFFDNIDEIVLMGGVTEPLILGGKQLDELNFSEDPAAAGLVLNAPVPVTVMTGNLCLQLFFGESELEILKSTSIPIYNYIYKQIVDWFFYSEKLVGKKGFYMWDLAAALYLTHKGHFDDNYVKITSNIEKLKKGYIEFEGVHNEEINLRQEGIVNLPTRISEVNLLKKEIFKSWAQVSMEEF